MVHFFENGAFFWKNTFFWKSWIPLLVPEIEGGTLSNEHHVGEGAEGEEERLVLEYSSSWIVAHIGSTRLILCHSDLIILGHLESFKVKFTYIISHKRYSRVILGNHKWSWNVLSLLVAWVIDNYHFILILKSQIVLYDWPSENMKLLFSLFLN